MKHSQNAGESGPAAVRTSELVPTSGIWRNHCSRPGCEFIEDLVLAAGAPAPPCRHCCNSSQLTYLGPAPTVLDETREGTIVGPRHFTMRVRGIVLTWLRDAQAPPPAVDGIPVRWGPPPGSRSSIALMNPEKAAPAEAAAHQEPAGEVPRSLFQKLAGKSAEKKA